jgi:hypothetical protein
VLADLAALPRVQLAEHAAIDIEATLLALARQGATA